MFFAIFLLPDQTGRHTEPYTVPYRSWEVNNQSMTTFTSTKIVLSNPEHNQPIILTRGVGQEQFEGIQLLLPLHRPGKDDIHDQKLWSKNDISVWQKILTMRILPDSGARQQLLGTLKMKDELGKFGSIVNFCKLTACDKPIHRRRQGWSRGLHHGSQSYPRYAPRIIGLNNP